MTTDTIDPYLEYARKLSPRGFDPLQSHKASRRADPAFKPCPDCSFSVHGCAYCSWIGVVPKHQSAPVCRHTYRHVGKIGNCLNTFQCEQCGDIKTVDSSD